MEIAQGDNRYNLSTLSSELSQDYRTEMNLTTVIVVASDESIQSYIDQWAVLETVDAESHQLIYVSALAHGQPDKDGYYIDADGAQSLLSDGDFSVHLYSSSGRLILRSNNVLPAKAIIEYASQY
ncbi:hypothetical protein [Reinekea blandensis]|uniref:hypothetical protein n=1 Tax=Reinekea blandensis TaxID=374838 RepID=UPI0012B60D80|nr:hypothetical protein [Reinekea blandensis]